MSISKNIINKIPTSSGIYLMLNSENQPIYIGKAQNIRKRVKSYFQKSNKHSAWTKKMIEKIEKIDFIETNSELEALIMETNFIKEKRPKYNILMKDDKNYVYIKITINEDFPQIYLVRQRLKDQALYFGPKTSSHETKKTLKFLNSLFPYRTCNLEIKLLDKQKSGNNDPSIVKTKGTSRKTPCLDYHIKRCLAPCINAVSYDHYHNLINQIILFLQGKKEKIIQTLKTKMINFAQNKNFEQAAKTRDLINNIQKTKATQLATDTKLIDQDIIAIQTQEKQTYVNLMQMRSGKIIDQLQFVMKNNTQKESELITAFIKNYYSETTSWPSIILLSIKIQEQYLITTWLNKISNKKIKILTPQKGKKNHLIELCLKNVKTFAKNSQTSFERLKNQDTTNTTNLQKILKINTPLNRIECYDISHFSGHDTVGSMIVFEKGKPKVSAYRKFKIKKLASDEIDDYKSLQEVLSRRLNRLIKKVPPKDIILSKAKKSDLPQITKSLKTAGLDITDMKTKEFIIAKKKQQVIGCARIKLYQDKTLELASLWVKKTARGQNLGYFIIQELFKKHKGQNIYLTTCPKNKNYYLNLGFRVIKLEKNIPPCIKNKAVTACSINKEKVSSDGFLTIKTPKSLSFETPPDLIIIDGGKGQLSSTNQVLKESGLNIPLISIAKREEEIFTLQQKKPIILDKNDPTLHLLQRIRDESHRFAINFNRNLRKKKLTKSKLDEIHGIGTKTKQKLLRKYGSVSEIKKRSLTELSQLIGESLAEKIKENL